MNWSNGKKTGNHIEHIVYIVTRILWFPVGFPFNPFWGKSWYRSAPANPLPPCPRSHGSWPRLPWRALRRRRDDLEHHPMRHGWLRLTGWLLDYIGLYIYMDYRLRLVGHDMDYRLRLVGLWTCLSKWAISGSEASANGSVHGPTNSRSRQDLPATDR